MVATSGYELFKNFHMIWYKFFKKFFAKFFENFFYYLRDFPFEFQIFLRGGRRCISTKKSKFFLRTFQNRRGDPFNFFSWSTISGGGRPLGIGLPSLFSPTSFFLREYQSIPLANSHIKFSNRIEKIFHIKMPSDQHFIKKFYESNHKNLIRLCFDTVVF